MKSLKIIRPYIYKYRRMLLLGVLFVILNNVAAIMVPPFVRQATDAIMSAQSVANSSLMSALRVFVFWILGFAILKGIFMFLMRQTIVVMSRWVENDLRSDMMSMALQQNQTFYSKFSVGDMMNRMSEDIAQVRAFCGPVIMYLVNTFSMMIMVIIMMLSVSPFLTMWVILPLPFLAILIFKINSKIYQKSVEIQETLSEMTSINQESFSNAKIIKALNAEQWTIDIFNKYSILNKSKNISLAKLRAWYFPLVQFFVTLSILLAIYIGGNRVIAGNLSYGNIVEFVLYINMIMFPIGSLGWVFAEMERAFSSLDRIGEVMAFKSKDKNLARVNFDRQIRIDDLQYTFDDTHRTALQKINLRFEQGKKYLLIGKIGSGKSTLISLLLGMREPTKGDIYIDELSLSDIDKDYFRKRIALVSQEPILFSDTIENNIKFYNKNIDEARYLKVLKDCKLSGEINKFSLGDQTVIGEKGVLLSGGQKQRIALARALINPQVDFFILDDPFSAVDIENEIKIWEKLKPYFENKTVIFIANKVSKAVNFDHVILLEDGEIEAMGRPEYMKNQSEFFANMMIG